MLILNMTKTVRTSYPCEPKASFSKYGNAQFQTVFFKLLALTDVTERINLEYGHIWYTAPPAVQTSS